MPSSGLHARPELLWYTFIHPGTHTHKRKELLFKKQLEHKIDSLGRNSEGSPCLSCIAISSPIVSSQQGLLAPGTLLTPSGYSQETPSPEHYPGETQRPREGRRDREGGKVRAWSPSQVNREPSVDRTGRRKEAGNSSGHTVPKCHLEWVHPGTTSVLHCVVLFPRADQSTAGRADFEVHCCLLLSLCCPVLLSTPPASVHLLFVLTPES